jgi:hypothetical protein
LCYASHDASATSTQLSTPVHPSRLLYAQWRRLTLLPSYVFFPNTGRKDIPVDRTERVEQNKMLYASLKEIDPEIQNIVDKETWRQLSGLELIASEVCLVFRFYRDVLDVDAG